MTTPTSFKDARKQLFESGLVFGNSDHFGESVTFRPGRGGAERTIVGPVTLESDEEVVVDYGHEKREYLWWQVAKDPACDRGGVAVFREHDVIFREGDGADEPWTFQTDRGIRNETPHSHEACFGRNRPTRYGPGR